LTNRRLGFVSKAWARRQSKSWCEVEEEFDDGGRESQLCWLQRVG
jgi:hypothetical protein